MNSDLYHHLSEIVEIQNARRKNFHGQTEPEDADLEKRHQLALEDHRAALERVEDQMRAEKAS